MTTRLRREIDAAARAAAEATGDERRAAIAKHVALCRELARAKRGESVEREESAPAQGELFG